jgi:hypothetical protein
MKHFLRAFAVLVFAGSTLFAQDAQRLASEGQRAYLANDVETARAKFEEALAIDPSNRVAGSYMRMIKAQEARSGGTGGGIEKQLRSLVLPEVKFTDATFGRALEYLKQNAAKQSVSVSFVVQPDVDPNAKVTLNLGRVPFLEALRYVCEMAGTKYDVEKFAIVIKRA